MSAPSPRVHDRFILTLLLVIVAILATGYAIWCHRQLRALEASIERQPVEPPEDRLVMRGATFSQLEGWSDDTLAEALPALRRSCELLERRDPGAALEPAAVGGTIADWLVPCRALLAVTDDDGLRRQFESNFVPVQILNNTAEVGLFTGYYEPSMSGSRLARSKGQVPLYRKPEDLVAIDLEQFNDRLAGRRISGRVADGTFKPYWERAEISSGALDGRQLELAWVDDPVDAFFLHIQGSGRIELAEGGELRVGYAGQNGRPYFAIGRELVSRGALTMEEVSLQSIRAWLARNQDQAADVMATNPSFVFFHELEGEGPVGTLGVPLTPRRSLAIDRTYLPLGIPVWLDGQAPDPETGEAQPLQRLLVAQDTGGAIKGPVRGDVFWGHGTEAESIAGRMKHEGRLWVLLPKALAARVLKQN